ncbi:hypothetical protein KKF91_17900 [Myxococcota bacterium]|nr:hypothetical protein [Myxococcota bacterium]MBU1432415.1 hypothetical protein [Myxococcota bacterium]
MATRITHWRALSRAIAEGLSWGLTPRAAIAAVLTTRGGSARAARLQGLAAHLDARLEAGERLSEAAAALGADVAFVQLIGEGERCGALPQAARAFLLQHEDEARVKRGLSAALTLPLITCLVIAASLGALRGGGGDGLLDGGRIGLGGLAATDVFALIRWVAGGVALLMIVVILAFNWSEAIARRLPRVGARRRAAEARGLAAALTLGQPLIEALDGLGLRVEAAALRAGRPLEVTLGQRPDGEALCAALSQGAKAPDALLRHAETLEAEAEALSEVGLDALRGGGTLLAALLIALALVLLHLNLTDLAGGVLR